MDQFSEIRPYLDHEVESVLTSLINDPDVLKALMGLQYPKYLSKIPFIKFVAKQRLKSRAKNIKTINDYQNIFKGLINGMIKDSISNFSVKGVSSLDPKSSYLFISNHRDITLDAALLNFALNKSGHKTFNFAVGNNLMEESWASDLMRLNKSFIIHRAGGTKKEIYSGLALASQFIHRTIFKTNESVWIAQKQGRAKDGIDQTDPAMLKMIHLSERKSQSVADYFNSLRIVPVSISYEFDPNDQLKARELYAKEIHKSYQKEKNEDLNSIAHGIKGFKGNVCINVSKPLKVNSTSAYEDLANEVTKKILLMYQLHPTNYAAAKLLNLEYESNFSDIDIELASEKLLLRVKGMEEGVRSKLLEQYANPLIQKTRLI